MRLSSPAELVGSDKTVHLRYIHHVCMISQNYAKLLIRNYF